MRPDARTPKGDVRPGSTNATKRHALVGVIVIVGLGVTYYIIQRLTGLFAIYPRLSLPPEWLDHGNWVQLTDHHLWQMVLAIVIVAIFSRGDFSKWGFNLKNLRMSFTLFKHFVVTFSVYVVGIGFVVQWLTTTRADQLAFLGYVPTPANIVGNLAFMGLLSGLSEEILFRGLFHTVLAQFFPGVRQWRGIEIPSAGIIAALIFTLAHINFSLSPFQVTHIYLPQLLLAFGLGMYYSIVFHKTMSLVAPILAHNFSNLALHLSTLLLIAAKS